MKRKNLLGALAVFALLLPSPASAQSFDDDIKEILVSQTIILTVNWTADAAGDIAISFSAIDDGTLVSQYAGLLIGRSAYYVKTIPGAAPDTPPTALYDVVIADEDGLDVFKGQLADRSATLPEDAAPQIGAVAPDKYGGPITCFGDWTITISNAGNGGQGTLKVYFR